jgi:glycosyltransferase involved in cell wall biosynthesis
MRILQAVPYFYPAWAYGGPAKLVFDTSRYFAQQGHDVIVYTSDAFDHDHRMPSAKRITNIPHLKVYYFRNIFNTFTYVYNVFCTPRLFLQALWQVPRIDVIHLHDFYTPHNLWLALLAKAFSKPYILSVHGCLESVRVAQRSLFKKVFLAFGGNWLLRAADSVIATSQNEVTAYSEYGVSKKKIKLLGHGVDPQEFASPLSKAQARRKWKLPQDKVVITFVGRIHKVKGLDLLVAATELLNAKQVEVVIAGSDDGYLDELKALIKAKGLTNIHLLGTCFGADKADLFKASDVFVYPSYSEGFSLGILEAGAAGLPLVITTGCHFPEVQKTGSGLVIEPKPKALADALQKMVDQPKRRQEASQRVQDLINQHYSQTVIGNRLLEIYSDVLQG